MRNTTITTGIRRMGKILFSQVCSCPRGKGGGYRGTLDHWSQVISLVGAWLVACPGSHQIEGRGYPSQIVRQGCPPPSRTTDGGPPGVLARLGLGYHPFPTPRQNTLWTGYRVVGKPLAFSHRRTFFYTFVFNASLNGSRIYQFKVGSEN